MPTALVSISLTGLLTFYTNSAHGNVCVWFAVYNLNLLENRTGCENDGIAKED
jgi:hypothetical protein